MTNSINLARLKLMNRKKGAKSTGPRIKGYRSCKCNAGHIHDSRGEAGHCNNLEYRKRAGDIKDYDQQTTFNFMINGKKICGHRVDFVVYGMDGRKWVEEYKGFETDVWKIKKKLFEALYPEIEYIVIKHKSKWRK